MTSKTAQGKARLRKAAENLRGMVAITLVTPGTMMDILFKSMAGDRDATYAMQAVAQMVGGMSASKQKLCGCCDHVFPDFQVPMSFAVMTPKEDGCADAIGLPLCDECALPKNINERAMTACRRL